MKVTETARNYKKKESDSLLEFAKIFFSSTIRLVDAIDQGIDPTNIDIEAPMTEGEAMYFKECLDKFKKERNKNERR